MTGTETTLNLVAYIKALYAGDRQLALVYRPGTLPEALAMLTTARRLLAAAQCGDPEQATAPDPDTLPEALALLVQTSIALTEATGGNPNYLEAMAQAIITVTEDTEP